MNDKIKLNYDKTYSSKYGRDYYRGKSFHYAGKWKVGTRYVSDEYNTDFVTHNNFILVCKYNHTATQENEPNVIFVDDEAKVNSKYWDVVIPSKAYDISQEEGDDAFKAISQKAVTDKLNALREAIAQNWDALSEDMDDLEDQQAAFSISLDTVGNKISANATPENRAMDKRYIDNSIDSVSSELNQRISDAEDSLVERYSSEIYQSAQNIRLDVTEEINNAINGVTEEYRSAINITADEINSSVEANKTELDGRIYELSSEISQTAGEIRSEVNDVRTNLDNSITTIRSEISQTADSITSRVEDLRDDVVNQYSEITQTTNAITLKVEELEDDVDNKYSEIIQTTDEISTTVVNNKSETDNSLLNLQSNISQTAEDIRAEVTSAKVDLEGSIENARAEIDMTTDAIVSTVEQNRLDANHEMSSIRSSIEQSADSITSRVEAVENDVANKYSEIIQTTDEISSTVSSNKSEIDGNLAELESNISQTAEEIRSEVNQQIHETETDITTAYTSAINQKADQITSSVTTTTNALNSRLVTAESNITQNANAISAEVTNRGTAISTLSSEIGAQLASHSAILSDLQNQIDGAIDTWFAEGVPTLNNAPAEDWTTNEDKDLHLGDIYYDNATGYAYRFTKENNTYSWIQVQDAIANALAAAATAQATADGKMRVFYGSTTPTGPYQEGDLWIQGHNGSNTGAIYITTTDRSDSLTHAEDWVLASDYTDIATVTAAFTIVADAITSRVYSNNSLIPYSVYTSINQTVKDIDLRIVDPNRTNPNSAGNKLADTGINISSGKIALTADNIILKNNSGERALTITNGSDGKPVIAATSLAVNDLQISGSQVNSGTLSSDRIPTLDQNKIDGLSTVLNSKASTTDLQGVSSSLTSSKNAIADHFGYADYDTMVAAAKANGATFIQGGYLNTNLIQAEAITADKIAAGAITADKIVSVGSNKVTGLGTLATKNNIGTSDLDSTIISGGYIKTDLIKANELVIGNRQVTGLGSLATKNTVSASTDVTGLGSLATKNSVSASTDVTGLATVATTGSYDSLSNKPSIPDVSNLADRDTFAQQLGYTNYNALVTAASNNQTIISGGYINTSLIEANAITANMINTQGLTITASQVSNPSAWGFLTSHQDLSNYMDKTTYISGGYIKTEFINTSAIQIGASQITDLNQQGFLTSHQSLAGYMQETTYIQGGYLKTSYIDVDNLQVKHLNSADGSFTGSINVNNAFNVDSSGNVTANTVTLRSGIIGGSTGNFTFGNSGGVSYLYNGISSLNATTGTGIYIGTDGINLGGGKFKVDAQGNLTATSINISYNNLSDTPSLSTVATSGNYSDLSNLPRIPTAITELTGSDNILYSSDVTIGTTSTANGLTTRTITVNGSSFTEIEGGDFVLTNIGKGTDQSGYNYTIINSNGLLKARNAIIYGTIYATEGQIGGLTLHESALTSTNFSLSSTGVLTATGATISGNITADSLTLGNNVTIGAGKVSGLATVATSGLYGDLTGKPDLSVYALSSAIPDMSANNDAFAQNLGYTNYQDLINKAASSSYGTLIQNGYINTALIQAQAITADMINTASLTVNKVDVKDSSNNTIAYIGNTSYPIIAGSSDPTSAAAKFKVASDGTLTATGVDMTGTINASGGNITGTLYIGSGGNLKSYAYNGNDNPTESSVTLNNSSLRFFNREVSTSYKYTIAINSDRIKLSKDNSSGFELAGMIINRNYIERYDQNTYVDGTYGTTEYAVFGASQYRINVVNQLPASPDANTLYFIKSS